MMQIVVSCDFLISPAFCAHHLFESRINDLITIKREMEVGGRRVVIEAETLVKLANLQYYPCAPIFKKNIPPELAEFFSPKDIAKVVHNIASMTVDQECSLPESVAYWDTKIINPNLIGCCHERSEGISQLVEEVFLANYIHEKALSILHHPLEEDIKSIDFFGELTHSIPETQPPAPLTVQNFVPVFSSYTDFLSKFDASEAYGKATTQLQIIDAFTLGAASIAKQHGKNGVFFYTCGDSFFDSLNEHQCAPGQRFANTAFDVICHVVAGVEKYAHKPMYSDLDKKEQIVKDGKCAWRTHITKGNPALRLMYWIEEGKIIIANVGNKNALEIF
ncbi:hypothetical protein M1M11_18000 [Pseudomonas azerbaijanoccidens]|jgi:hypothetical protein|uniref:hypothetical protein n=1 Tax=Pseudomonas azerbaijanoccidentalis TaxID=2842347 RepID=UPI002009F1AE|nr:hypothetical protein [Pseudomonas azerbaijanoccidentalis]MCK8666779.1 hypothetical protein [Pseudomonas azerbaijanoccidentalis]